MKKNLLTIFTISIAIVSFSLAVFAQENRNISSTASKYVISAEAGAVNFIDGKVAIARKTGRSGLLLKGDTVKIGDRVSTEGESKAEVLLNPGSYIRIGGDSSFEFVDTSLENLQINLYHGSAIFEIITTDGFTFSVSTPKASFNVVQSGVYRIDVMADGTGKIEVWKGKALIGDDEDTKIKKGKSATVGGDEVAVAKFDRGDRDELEDWSRQRAKDLAKANERLERSSLRNSLITGFNSRSWNLYDSFGLWIYDPFWGSYCFLPFGYGWSSPYGFGFGRDLWFYRLPSYIYNQPPVRVLAQSGNGSGTNTGNETVNNTTREVRKVTPPFQQVDQGNSGRKRMSEDDFPSIFPTQTVPSRMPSSTPRSTGTASETVQTTVKGKPDQ